MVVFPLHLSYDNTVMKHRYVRIVLVIAVLTLFASLCVPLVSAPTVEHLATIDRALILAERGNFDAARAMLSAVQSPERADAVLLAARGSVELAANNHVAAEPYFRAALEVDPQQTAALWGLALCLQQAGRAHEAAPLLDRAALAAPNDRRVITVQAYSYLQLNRISDAAQAGKAALAAGERSPFLMAVLAKIHYRMGYPAKAVEFAAVAAKTYQQMDWPQGAYGVLLPQTVGIVDTPAALTNFPAEVPLPDPKIAMPVMETNALAPAPARFQIIAPAPNSTVQGVVRVQTVYHGSREIGFVVMLVDGVTRGLATRQPFEFYWNADLAAAGAHQISVRVYDKQGMSSDAHAVTVLTTGGQMPPAPEPTTQVTALLDRMMQLTMPRPQPLALFTDLSKWYLELNDAPQAINALEKVVALDPANPVTLQTLRTLYQREAVPMITATGEVYNGPATGKKRVALTFDDGPNPLYTPTIMALLDQYHAHATFFLVGKMVQQYPDLTRELLSHGHELANHTYNHPNLTLLPAQEVIREALLDRNIIKSVTGRDTYLFRPPGGNIDAEVASELHQLNYSIIYWGINAGEYTRFDPARQAEQILARIKDGNIVLLHNGPVDGTMMILPILLRELARRGFTCVTVSELMKQ